jgi:integrase
MAKPPTKPYPDFPLFAHQSGQWSKKIRGRHEYFGVWADPDAALAKYLQDRDYLQAGQTPPGEQATLADVLNGFYDDKERSLEAGEITQRTFDEYEAVCVIIGETLGKHREVATIGYDDLGKLRSVLNKGKGGRQLSPVSVKRFLSLARMVFHFANEEMGHSIRYKKALRSPAARVLRQARNEVGERLFTPKELCALVKLARPQVRAMILLGINCGFGNGDCGTLPIEAIDLKGGWHNYWRPKTQVARRCPLWPETVKALKAVIGDRTSGLVFVTKYGNPWTHDGRRDPIAFEFRKLMGDKHRKSVTTFYSLRRTFETIAATGGVPQSVIDAIMGHVPHVKDMSAVYRQKVYDDMLRKCVEHVRQWYLGKVKIA